MQAFPKDSLNNILGVGGPLNKKPDHATFLGNNDDEAFRDYSKGGSNQNGYEPYNASQPSAVAPTIISSTSKVDPVHGDETLGLGTSTFLEGAPASRTAMQRRESELATPTDGPGGLGRKKSLAQKIRGINNPRRDYGPRVTSPGASGQAVYSPIGMDSPPAYTPGGTRSESNPFFNEYSKGDDKKESLTFVEPVREGRAGPSSPKALERRVTSDGSSGADQAGKPGGFLARVKSLKGGSRRPREKPLPQPQIMDS